MSKNPIYALERECLKAPLCKGSCLRPEAETEGLCREILRICRQAGEHETCCRLNPSGSPTGDPPPLTQGRLLTCKMKDPSSFFDTLEDPSGFGTGGILLCFSAAADDAVIAVGGGLINKSVEQAEQDEGADVCHDHRDNILQME